ncbi:MAG: hypothetical protein Q4B14_07195 [Clostridia bacterium]|nr:hypothetical protein [Clostridia bacterium]
MVTLIIGNRGSGKTKKLIDLANEKVKETKGNVVVVEKGQKLTYNLSYQARLVDVDEYKIKGYNGLYGFLGGICAGNYDLTDIFVDSTFKICGDDMDELKKFIDDISVLADKSNVSITFLISSDKKSVPDDLPVEYMVL